MRLGPKLRQQLSILGAKLGGFLIDDVDPNARADLYYTGGVYTIALYNNYGYLITSSWKKDGELDLDIVTPILNRLIEEYKATNI